MPELISIILATYNREDALDVVLRSLSRQSDSDFEIVVADDGSTQRTAEIVTEWKRRLGVAVTHVWHADTGFRLAEIRNRAIVRSSGTYCIFLDGDCIVPADFVAAHRALAEPNWFVAGNRILLSRAVTESIFRDHLAPDQWGLGDVVKLRLKGDVNRAAPFVRLPLGVLRKMQPRNWRDVRMCNFGVFRADLDRVDGFDAIYQGWGREDSDLVVRLLHAGVRRKGGHFATGVLHLWHPEANRSRLQENDQRLQALLRGTRTRAERGLSEVASEKTHGVAHPPQGRY